MWFRYLISFLDIGLTGIMGLYAIESKKEERIISLFLVFVTISNVILMWR